MNVEQTSGAALTFFGAVGYVVGVVAPYPGRSLSLVGVMVGITLWAVGTSGGGEP
jgi:hypothetical protein